MNGRLARNLGRRRGAPLGLVALVCLSLSCGDDQTRAIDHLENARELIAEANEAEAALELQNVLMLEPANVEAHNALGELQLGVGDYRSALEHFEAAHRADPTDRRAALNFARMLVLQVRDLERAAALIDQSIEAAPDDASGYIARSNLEIAAGRLVPALAAANRALELAPEDPHASWQLGRVLQARIAEALASGKVAAPPVYDNALAAFDAYVAKGGPDPLSAALERARVVAARPGQEKEAADLYRAAVEQAFADARPPIRERTLRRTVEYAGKVQDDALLDWALGKLLEVQPSDVPTWVALSQVRKRRGRSSEAVMQQMLERLPTDAAAHVEYARHVISQGELDRALEHLEKEAATPGRDAPLLLGAIANTQLAAGRNADAERTLERLEREYPRHPRTVLERAQVDLKSGSPGRAAKQLRVLAEHAPSFDGYRLLALAEERLGNTPAAIDAIERAIELRRSFSYEEEMLRVRWLAKVGLFQRVVHALERIRDRAPTTNEQLLLMARARYETGRPFLGRILLEQLLREPTPPARAVIEYAHREGLSRDEEIRARAYAALEALLVRAPQNVRALEEISRIDTENGQVPRAIARIDALEDGDGDLHPTVLLLRSGLHASIDQDDAALDDARKAFQREPRHPGTSDLLVALHLKKGDEQAAMQASIAAANLGVLSPAGLVRLGRMYRKVGADRLALESFESAYAAGADDPQLKNDIAYLLAELGQDLGRALAMAKEASTELQGDPNAVDTLGYVYLRSGAPKVALTHFEDAVARAKAPEPGFYYHLGLALQHLEREPEAAQAFERALAISTTRREGTERDGR